MDPQPPPVRHRRRRARSWSTLPCRCPSKARPSPATPTRQRCGPRSDSKSTGCTTTIRDASSCHDPSSRRCTTSSSRTESCSVSRQTMSGTRWSICASSFRMRGTDTEQAPISTCITGQWLTVGQSQRRQQQPSNSYALFSHQSHSYVSIFLCVQLLLQLPPLVRTHQRAAMVLPEAHEALLRLALIRFDHAALPTTQRDPAPVVSYV